MLIKIRNMLNQKGQGIIEYALILAFVVGIGMMLKGANLGSAVVGVFDDVAEVLSGVKKDAYVAALAKWGKAKREDFKEDTRDERLAADQQALINIGNFFLGKQRNVVEEAVGKTQTTDLLLVQMNDEILYDNSIFTRKSGADRDSTDGRVFNWMQGDYGTVTIDDNGIVSITGYDESKSYKAITDDERIAGRTDYNFNQKTYSSTRYLYSDYAIYNQTGYNEGNGKFNAQNGIKVDLTYTQNPDYPNDRSKDIVSGVSVYVNKNSNDENQVTSSTNSRGLKVTLEAGKDPVRQEAKY